MKKIFPILLLLCLACSVVKAQTAFPYKVKFKVIPAHCYNDGMVLYTLLNEDGTEMTEAQYADLKNNSVLDKFEIYHKLHITDEKQKSGLEYNGGWDTLLIDYGTYYIGVEGVYNDPSTSTIKWIEIDTLTLLEVPTTYTVPEASAIYTTAYTEDGFGRWPTIACENMGRIQLIIENGRFPYHISIVKHGTTDTLRKVTITEPQYDGENPWFYNYKNYYTFDNLPAGDWDFYLEDGCEYGLPRTGQTVEVVDLPFLEDVEVFASTGNFADSNIVKINAVLNTPPYEYMIRKFSPYMQYCFTFNGHTSAWKSFPDGNQHKVLLYDTIAGDHKYCDFLGDDITLNYRINYGTCDHKEISKTIQLHLPNKNYFKSDSLTVNDSLKSMQNCEFATFKHKEAYTIHYQDFLPDYVTAGGDHNWIRYHYTHPLTWIYTDAETNTEIKREVVDDISDTSKITISEMQAFYHLNYPIKKNINRKLVDAHGCELYSKTILMNFDTVKIGESPFWSISHTNGDHCCNVPRTINIFETIPSNSNYTSIYQRVTQINLVKSPYNNRYNFSATFNALERSWTIHKNNLANTAIIEGDDDGNILHIDDYCLPSGPYIFEITTNCGTYTVSQNIDFPDFYSTEIVEQPEFSTIQQCSDLYITYSKGQVARVAKDTDPATGLPRADIYTPLTTYFQFVEGPVGGYDNHAYQLNDQIRISIPGTYVLKVYPEASEDLCDIVEHYDTIVYSGATVQFDYAYALLCDVHDDKGNAYVGAFDGTLPYKYTLYSGVDLTGEVLAVNDSGIFKNVPMNVTKEMSCKVEDACGAYFHVNFYPQATADLQKTWFAEGLRATVTCEGALIQVHALKIKNIFEYEWTGPGGFHSTSSDPYIFIERNTNSGYYKVKISQHDCQETIFDSIYLTIKPAPLVEISQDTTICPGEEVELTFKPISKFAPMPVEFDIVFENSEDVEVRHYGPVPSGELVTDVFRTVSPAKIYPLLVVDDSCDYAYAHPSDTTYIKIKSDVVDMCTIETTNQMVCFGNNATLTARSTMQPPYSISWYSDFELTDLLKTETINSAEDWSKYDTANITRRTTLFVTIAAEGHCPSVNGIVSGRQNLSAGKTTLACGQSIRVYDDGGKDGEYSTGSDFIYHTYKSLNGDPLVMKIEDIDLSETSHLFVLRGSEPVIDSMLYNFTFGSEIPDIIVSPSSELTLFFLPGLESAAGWSILIEQTPGVAIADVYNRNHTTLYDIVCESKSEPYDDIHNFANGDNTMIEQLNQARRSAGTHLFDRNEISTVTGCDSTISLALVVLPPPLSHVNALTHSLINGGNYEWHGKVYNTTGQFADTISLAGGCDSIVILNLVILQIDTSDNEICIGDSTTLGVRVITPEISREEGNVIYHRQPGDILCTDGNVLSPDSFLLSGKTPMGIVFWVDNNGINGKAIALTDAYKDKLAWARDEVHLFVHGAYERTTSSGVVYYGYLDSPTIEVATDMNGYMNTLSIRNSALNATDQNFRLNAPAAYYCFYYNHNNDAIPSNANPDIEEDHIGWYLPSAGELNLFYVNRSFVNKTLSLLKENGFNASLPNMNGEESYWSSTEGYSNANITLARKAFFVQGKGQINGNHSKKDVWSKVRAIRTF